MNYTQAIDYIHSVSWKGSRPGLARIEKLMSLCGNPQNKLRFVHVAGTNGKGSFCAMLASILREAGYKTGLFVSPYVLRFSERMRVDGVDISEEELASIITCLQPLCDKMEDAPTEFELITAAAFLYFCRHSCDIVVLEAGMGGRLDSTNIIESSVLSVITGIAMDHAEFLGDTLPKIATEKAGIVKENGRVLYGGSDDDIFDVIKEKCDEKSALCRRTNYGALRVHHCGLDGSNLSFLQYENVFVSLAGAYQPRNVCTVLTAVDMLIESGFVITRAHIDRGLASVRWPARFECLQKKPPVIYDGGHNPQGILACAESLRICFGSQKVILLCGVMKDKDYEQMISIIKPHVALALTVKPDNPRALSAEDLAAAFDRHGVEAKSFFNMDEALEQGLALASAQHLPLLALGSLYMYAEFRAAFDKASY